MWKHNQKIIIKESLVFMGKKITNPVIELLNRHRSVRKYRSEPVADEMVEAIIEAAGRAATSNFIQAYSVIRVRNTAIRKQIARLAGPQEWVETSPVFMVFCADLNRAKNACILEDTRMDAGYTEQFIIATVDVSLMAQNAMIAAESLGLGGVYIGGVRNDPQTVCDLLKIPDHVYPVFGLCLGFPLREQEQKPRMPVSMILKEEIYHEDEPDLSAYNRTCEGYYRHRSRGARQDTWTGQISRMMDRPSRPHMREFLNRKGFEFK